MDKLSVLTPYSISSPLEIRMDKTDFLSYAGWIALYFLVAFTLILALIAFFIDSKKNGSIRKRKRQERTKRGR